MPRDQKATGPVARVVDQRATLGGAAIFRKALAVPLPLRAARGARETLVERGGATPD